MKKFILAAFLMLTVHCAMAQMPNVKIENGKGEIIETTSLVDGKTPMIISFWSTTCKPCIRELNTINDLMDEWKENIDFRVIAVSIDDSRSASKAKSMAEGFGWENFTVLYDKNQEFKRAMNVNLVPQVYVMDGTGKIVYSHTGYTPGGENELYDVIEKLNE